MTLTARLPIRAALAAALAALAGCGELATLRSVATPTDVYVLTPKSTYDPTLPSVEAQLVVEEPTANAAVNTDRIAVKPTQYQVQYFPTSRWAERAPTIVQSMLIESYENTGKVGAVGRSAVGLRADFVVVSDLREFQARVLPDDPLGPPEVIVRLNLKIVQSPDDVIVASESFGRVRRAESSDMFDVVTAFDEALGGSMRDAVEWSVRVMDEFEERRRRRGY